MNNELKERLKAHYENSIGEVLENLIQETFGRGPTAMLSINEETMEPVVRVFPADSDETDGVQIEIPWSSLVEDSRELEGHVFHVWVPALEQLLAKLKPLRDADSDSFLSQPRAVLITLREALKNDPDAVRLCDSGINTLTEFIGDGFKL